MKLSIAVDMDGILVDCIGYWFKRLEEKRGVKGDIHTLAQYDLSKHPPFASLVVEFGEKAVFEIMHEPDFFDRMAPLPGAIDAMHQLQAAGHRVVLLTSAPSADGMMGKARWVKEHLGAGFREICFVRAENKQFYDADVYIDDHPETLAQLADRYFSDSGALRLITGIVYPYNVRVDHPDVELAENYKDTAMAWRHILLRINELSMAKDEGFA